jgi:16S rRNA (adenine1518-N6/adenine1519-N6)-dimethyltransferase
MGARLDQHFLRSSDICDAIIVAAGLSAREQVLEIGPGRGILTRALLSRGIQVTAVEIDEGLAAGLAEDFSRETQLKLIRADFLRMDLAGLGAGPFKIVANLPYSVASPILQRLLPWPHWSEALLMFQKEVAERITASAGNRRYGLLTLSVLIYAEAEPVLNVPKECFLPVPKVDSAILRLRRRPRPLLAEKETRIFFRVAQAAFRQRRKIASGPIAQALGLPKSKVREALRVLGAGPLCRAEEIPLEIYLKLPETLGL